MKRRRANAKSDEPAVRRSGRVTRSSSQDNGSQIVSEVNESAFLLECMNESCVDLHGNLESQSRAMGSSLQSTLMAFLDTHGAADEFSLTEQFTFINNIQLMCVRQTNAYIPTKKIVEGVIRIVQRSQSIELTMACSCLLEALGKHPRIAVAEEADKLCGPAKVNLHVDERVWSPLEEALRKPESDIVSALARKEAVPLNLLALLEQIAADLSKAPATYNEVKACGQYHVLNYLITLLQKDLYSRVSVSQASMDGTLLRQSYVYKLLLNLQSGPRTGFFSSLLSILDPKSQQNRKVAGESDEKERVAASESQDVSFCTENDLCFTSVEFRELASNLMLMVVTVYLFARPWILGNTVLQQNDRDASKTEFVNNFSKASDLEICLKAIGNPYVKLRFVVDFFVNFYPGGLDLNGLSKTIDGDAVKRFFNCFIDEKISIFVHKFAEHVLPTLLASAFQAFLLISRETSCNADEEEGLPQDQGVMEVCQLLIVSLTALKDFEGQTEMSPFVEETLEMAELILQGYGSDLVC